MSYYWYRTDSAYHRHPKMLALKALLKQPLADAYVSRLWSWTQVYAPSGRFPVTLGVGLESELGWTECDGALNAALVASGWLDRVGDDFEVHDWADYQEYYAKKSKKDAAKKRQKRHRASRFGHASVTRDTRVTAPPTYAPSRVTAPPTYVRTDVRTDGTNNTTPLVLVDVEPTLPAREVFEHWRKATGKARAVLDPKRRDLIDRRLAEGNRVEDLKAAIDGYAKSPWHNGENDRRRKFLALELMLRDAEHIEAGMDLLAADNGIAPKSRVLTGSEDPYAEPTETANG